MIINTMLDVKIYQVIEKRKLINKAGLFEDDLWIRDLDYNDLRLLIDNGVDLFDCKGNEYLNKLI